MLVQQRQRKVVSNFTVEGGPLYIFNMKLLELVLRLAKPIFIERPGNQQSLEEHMAAFVQTTVPIETRIRKAQRPEADEIIRHIIGIERWGQNRLRVALGSPLVMDEHHAYKPPRGLSKDRLLIEFRNTRIQTLELIQKLKGTIDPQHIPHNSMGMLTTRGWLYYLRLHADWESRRLR